MANTVERTITIKTNAEAGPIDKLVDSFNSLKKRLNETAKEMKGNLKDAMNDTKNNMKQSKTDIKDLKKAWIAMGLAAIKMMHWMISVSPHLQAQTKRMNRQFNKLGRDMGKLLAPAFKLIADLIEKVINWFLGLPEPIRMFVVVMIATTAAVFALSIAIGVITAVSSPWLLIIIAIIAAITAIILIIIYWEEIVQYLVTAFQDANIWMKILVVVILSIVAPILLLVAAIIYLWEVMGGWEGIKESWSDLKTTISDIWISMIEGLTAGWESFTTWISDSITAIGSFFSDAWATIVTSVSDAWNGMITGLIDGWNSFTETIQDGIETISSFFTDFGTTVSDLWSGLWSGLTTSFESFSDNISKLWDSFFDILNSSDLAEKTLKLLVDTGMVDIYNNFIVGIDGFLDKIHDVEIGGVNPFNWVPTDFTKFSMPSLDVGGPIPNDTVAQVHSGEWMLTAADVRALGGFSGVDSMVKGLRSGVSGGTSNGPSRGSSSRSIQASFYFTINESKNGAQTVNLISRKIMNDMQRLV